MPQSRDRYREYQREYQAARRAAKRAREGIDAGDHQSPREPINPPAIATFPTGTMPYRLPKAMTRAQRSHPPRRDTAPDAIKAHLSWIAEHVGMLERRLAALEQRALRETMDGLTLLATTADE